MYNRICEQCTHHCKQDESAKVVQCPRFQKRLTDNEFKDLINELDDMESQAKVLKKRTENLIKLAQNADSANADTAEDSSGDDEDTDIDTDSTDDSIPADDES